MNTDILPKGQANILGIKTALATVSAWRCTVSQKWPGDARNVKAATILETLAGEPVSNLPDDLIAKVAEHHGSTEAAKELASRVGFSLFPASLSEFLYSVLLRLNEQQKDIERTFSKKDGAR